MILLPASTPGIWDYKLSPALTTASFRKCYVEHLRLELGAILSLLLGFQGFAIMPDLISSFDNDYFYFFMGVTAKKPVWNWFKEELEGKLKIWGVLYSSFTM